MDFPEFLALLTGAANKDNEVEDVTKDKDYIKDASTFNVDKDKEVVSNVDNDDNVDNEDNEDNENIVNDKDKNVDNNNIEKVVEDKQKSDISKEASELKALLEERENKIQELEEKINKSAIEAVKLKYSLADEDYASFAGSSVEEKEVNIKKVLERMEKQGYKLIEGASLSDEEKTVSFDISKVNVRGY